jgi:hypothetical protein
MIHLTTSEPLMFCNFKGMGVAEPPKPLTRPSLGRVMFFAATIKNPPRIFDVFAGLPVAS